MGTKVNIFVLLLLVLLLGCREEKIENYDIAPLLTVKANLARKSQKAVKMEVCNFASFNWDKIIVVRPYTTRSTITGYNLENSQYVENNLLDTLSIEMHSLLLFVEQNKIARYSYVPRTLIDFCYINDEIVSKAISRKNSMSAALCKRSKFEFETVLLIL